MKAYFTNRGAVTPMRIDGYCTRYKGHYTKLIAQIYSDRIKEYDQQYNLRRAVNDC